MNKKNCFLFLSLLVLCLSCTGPLTSSGNLKDEELLQVYTLWKNKASKVEVIKLIGKEFKISSHHEREQISFIQDGHYLPKMVIELVRGSDRISSVFYSPSNLDANKMKNTLPCSKWEVKTKSNEMKDYIYTETVLTCMTEEIQAKLQNNGQVDELWFSGNE